jgi:hypothetical protein
MAFTEKHPLRSKMDVCDEPIQEDYHFKYFWCTISVFEKQHLEISLSKFNHK